MPTHNLTLQIVGLGSARDLALPEPASGLVGASLWMKDRIDFEGVMTLIVLKLDQMHLRSSTRHDIGGLAIRSVSWGRRQPERRRNHSCAD